MYKWGYVQTLKCKSRSPLKSSGMLLRPTTIFTIVSFLGLCEGIHRMSALLWLKPCWAYTHMHKLTQVRRERDRLFFFFSFIAVWQGDLIPNVLYQAWPILSIIKRMNIDFLQENQDISFRDVWFHHLVQKFHSARILLYMLCCSIFNYPSRIFQQSNPYFSG